MLARGGISGRPRVTRHLWRMCCGLFFATGSFFLGQQQVFPALLRGSIFLTVLALLPFPLMIYWLIRVRSAMLTKYTHKPVRLPSLREAGGPYRSHSVFLALRSKVLQQARRTRGGGAFRRAA